MCLCEKYPSYRCLCEKYPSYRYLCDTLESITIVTCVGTIIYFDKLCCDKLCDYIVLYEIVNSLSIFIRDAYVSCSCVTYLNHH